MIIKNNLNQPIPKRFIANRFFFFIVISKILLKLFGWNISGQIPDEEKLIAIAAPHTSNWDFVIAMLAILSLDIKVKWLGKESIFKNGTTWFFKWLGGIPVNREKPASLIEDIAKIVEQDSSIIVAITPEGSRRKVNKWKSGFLRIAEITKGKILLISLDFPTKDIHIGEIFIPSGNKEIDIEFVKKYYSSFQGIHPENS